MHSILAASDLSDRSDRALRRAVQLATDFDAKLTVVHVVDSAMPHDLAETICTQAEETLQDQLRACHPEPALDCDVRTIIGDPMEDVTDLAADIGAELIVLGVHRARKHFDLIRQTTMEHLIRISTIPVLLVSNATKKSYKQLLCAVDMSKACAHAVALGHDIAPDAKMRLFHAYHAPYRRLTNKSDAAATTLPFRKEAEQEFAQWRVDNALPADLPEPRFIDASPAIALERMLVEDAADLLALGAHSRSNLGRFMLGGFTSTLIRNPPCDLLVAR